MLVLERRVTISDGRIENVMTDDLLTAKPVLLLKIRHLLKRIVFNEDKLPFDDKSSRSGTIHICWVPVGSQQMSVTSGLEALSSMGILS